MSGDGSRVPGVLTSFQVFDGYLSSSESVVVAVSGGVDSTSLGLLLHRLAREPQRVRWMHARTPAVPASHSQRVERIALDNGVAFEVVVSGEFEDERYLSNPINRCYFCKANLFKEIARRAPNALVLTGANVDDLRDYRPGLKAAAELGVRHPFVDAKYTKANIRELAQILGLAELSTAPSSPCLSSRVLTGTRIEPDILARIEMVEQRLSEAIGPADHRCRFGGGRVVVQIDERFLPGVSPVVIEGLCLYAALVFDLPRSQVEFQKYVRGSAFVEAW